MSNEAGRAMLSLVKGGREHCDNVSACEPVQVALFTSPRSASAVFVSFSRLTEADFINALEYARPTLILELRVCPRFDLGRLNRRAAFQRFDAINSRYFDLCAEGSDLLFRLRAFLRRFGDQITGPVMFLLDNPARDLEDDIAQALNETSSQAWDICELPREVQRLGATCS
jgi:hypothetical protein